MNSPQEIPINIDIKRLHSNIGLDDEAIRADREFFEYLTDIEEIDLPCADCPRMNGVSEVAGRLVTKSDLLMFMPDGVPEEQVEYARNNPNTVMWSWVDTDHNQSETFVFLNDVSNCTGPKKAKKLSFKKYCGSTS